jgi:outer membrane protein TolC
MTMKKNLILKSVGIRPSLVAASCMLFLAGCTIIPKPLTQEEVKARVVDDVKQIYEGQDAITGPVSMEEALARSIKYNLDYRLKRMESALALGLSDYSSADMLPKLVVSAGYRDRSNDSGGISQTILGRVDSAVPTTSDERSRTTRGIELSWNLLDFGVSYYRSKQQANQFLVAEERRRKVVQNILQDVRGAYWRALGAQRLNAQADEIVKRADAALARSREAEAQKAIPPGVALAYQRALLDSTTLLNQRRQDLQFAKRELAALMNVPSGVDFQLAEASEVALPLSPKDVARLEEMALLQRPELREEDLRRRIAADEVRKQFLSILPGINLSLGRQGDSNRFSYNNNWTEGSANVAWNLMRLVSLPAGKRSQEFQLETDETRRQALSVAILTQTRIAVERYNMALEDFKIADQAAQVDTRLAAFTKASVSARLESELEAIRTQARAVLGAYQRANAYSSAHIAFGRLYSTLGLDPLADDFAGDDLKVLTKKAADHLKTSQDRAFEMSSNLFGRLPTVNVKVEGLPDTAQHIRVMAAVKGILERQNIGFDENAPRSLALSFNLTNDGQLDRANWAIRMLDANAAPTPESTKFSVAVPRDANRATLENTAIAAINTHLKGIKAWADQ